MSRPGQPQTFASTVQEFYKSHAMFVAVLEQLQQQLAGLAKEDTPAAPPAILQRVAAKAPTPGLEAYFAQRHPQPPPPANLAEQIDMNLRVLQVLAAEMRGFDALLQGLLGDVGRPGAAGQGPAERGSADHGPPGQGLAHPGAAEQGQSDAQPDPAEQLSDQGAAAQGDAIPADSQRLLRAAAAEGIQKEMTLIERVAAAVSLDMLPDELATYAKLLKCKPFLLDQEAAQQLSG